MSHSKYLIIGSSHAGLSALDAIRVRDNEGSVILITREEFMPYSPTILPYVVSGKSGPEKIYLRNEADMERLGVEFRRRTRVVTLNTADRNITLESGERLGYEKLLLATGAAPVPPSFEGLGDVPYQVLRTLDDALRLRRTMESARSAVVLGAGLIAMHTAEKLAKAGKDVTVVVRSRVLRGYFDEEGSGLVRQIFSAHGIRVITGMGVSRVDKSNGGCVVCLESGEELFSDLLLAATGVKPCIDYLIGSGIETDEGILVDRRMRTNIDNIYAAGDVAEAPDFFTSEPKVIPILSNAVTQGKIAGANMAGEEAKYEGGISMNVFNFFGNRAFSIGLSTPRQSSNGGQVLEERDEEQKRFKRLVFQEDKLIGAMFLNVDLNPGVILYLIKNQVDIGPYTEILFQQPKEISHWLMLETEKKETVALEK